MLFSLSSFYNNNNNNNNYYYYYCYYYYYYYYYYYHHFLYSRYVLSKLSWHFTIANISKTLITEHLDSAVNGYFRKWLDIPISGTLSSVFLERNKFGLNICPPCIKFTQCQTVLRNSLKQSPDEQNQRENRRVIVLVLSLSHVVLYS